METTTRTEWAVFYKGLVCVTVSSLDDATDYIYRAVTAGNYVDDYDVYNRQTVVVVTEWELVK